jgi:phosphatidylglycerol lysyltransferase
MSSPSAVTMSIATRGPAFLRRIPFTLSVVGVMLLLGIMTGTLWNSLQNRELFQTVAYGYPPISAGHVWTVVTGALFALEPAQYLPVAGGFLLMVGFAEIKLGTRRVVIAAIACQLVGIVGTAAMLGMLIRVFPDYGWAQLRVTNIDVGFSAGVLGALAASAAALRTPWANRLRVILIVYGVVMVLWFGLIWDPEHLIAITFGLLLGPVLLGRRPRLAIHELPPEEWRLFAAFALLAAALVRIGLYLQPSDGPLGASNPNGSMTFLVIATMFCLPLAEGLRRGLTLAWWLTLAYLAVMGAALVVAVVHLVMSGTTSTSGRLGDLAPAIGIELVLWILLLAALLPARSAFGRGSALETGATVRAAPSG